MRQVVEKNVVDWLAGFGLSGFVREFQGDIREFQVDIRGLEGGF